MPAGGKQPGSPRFPFTHARAPLAPSALARSLAKSKGGRTGSGGGAERFFATPDVSPSLFPARSPQPRTSVLPSPLQEPCLLKQLSSCRCHGYGTFHEFCKPFSRFYSRGNEKAPRSKSRNLSKHRKQRCSDQVSNTMQKQQAV